MTKPDFIRNSKSHDHCQRAAISTSFFASSLLSSNSISPSSSFSFSPVSLSPDSDPDSSSNFFSSTHSTIYLTQFSITLISFLTFPTSQKYSLQSSIFSLCISLTSFLNSLFSFPSPSSIASIFIIWAVTKALQLSCDSTSLYSLPLSSSTLFHFLPFSNPFPFPFLFFLPLNFPPLLNIPSYFFLILPLSSCIFFSWPRTTGMISLY